MSIQINKSKTKNICLWSPTLTSYPLKWVWKHRKKLDEMKPFYEWLANYQYHFFKLLDQNASQFTYGPRAIVSLCLMSTIRSVWPVSFQRDHPTLGCAIHKFLFQFFVGVAHTKRYVHAAPAGLVHRTPAQVKKKTECFFLFEILCHSLVFRRNTYILNTNDFS